MVRVVRGVSHKSTSSEDENTALNPAKFISNDNSPIVVPGCYSLLNFVGKICTSEEKTPAIFKDSNNNPRLSAATHLPRQSPCFMTGYTGAPRGKGLA